MKSSSKQR